MLCSLPAGGCPPSASPRLGVSLARSPIRRAAVLMEQRRALLTAAAAGAVLASAIWLLARRQAKSKRGARVLELEHAGLPTPISRPAPAASPPVPATQSRFALPRTPTLVIGIAGGSASGKSFFTDALRQRLHQIDGVWCACLSHDSYYKDKAQVDAECDGNWDCPEALHTHECVDAIRALVRGEPISVPHYDFSVSARNPALSVELQPPRASTGELVVILVEGMMIFNDEELNESCQLRVFVDCDEDTRFMRRLSRDTDDGAGGRGRSVASVFRQWSEVVKPAHQQFVEPTKRHAHMVVPSRGLKVPTHLRRRSSQSASPRASVVDDDDEPSLQSIVGLASTPNGSLAKGGAEALVDGMMMPALQLIEAYVKQTRSERAHQLG